MTNQLSASMLMGHFICWTIRGPVSSQKCSPRTWRKIGTK